MKLELEGLEGLVKQPQRAWLRERVPAGLLARLQDRNWTIPRWLWLSALLFGVTRLGIALVAYIAVPLIADGPVPPYHLRAPDNILVDAFGSRWDTGFYVSIAEEGYKYLGVPLPSVAFFPLYPLLIRALTPLLGDTLMAGLVISNVALLLATMLFYRLVADGWGERTADRAVWYFLIFPAAFFGSALYTESLFILTVVGALFLSRHGYWESAALLGIAAALTRFIGLIVAPMLLVEWWWQRRSRPAGARPPLKALLAPAVAPLGTGAYMFYLWRVFGEPLAFVKGAAAWARTPSSPLASLTEGLGLQHLTPADILAGRLPLDNWIDFAFVLLFLSLGLALLYKHRWSEAVFVLLGTIIPFSSGLLMSQRRYMWVLFPAFIVLAQWGERPWVDRLITTVSLLALGLFTALFASGYWVG